MVGYTYDAWGNCTIDSLTTNYDLAHDNPIRYRGYYYDEDTKLYYLNSRYYSPEWRRFISPDDTAYLDSETPNGLNLYCYCGNDPVNYADPSGHEAKWLAWLISGVLVTAGIVACAVAAPGIFGLGLIGGICIGIGAGSIINGYVTEANGGSFWGGYIGGAISGALCAVGAGFGGLVFALATKSVGTLCLGYLSLGCLTSFAGGFLGNFAGTIYTDWHNSGFNSVNLDMSELLSTSAIMGTLNIFAGMGSGVSSIIGEMGKIKGINANSQLAHRILAGTVAASTEAFYDITSYLYGFWN